MALGSVRVNEEFAEDPALRREAMRRAVEAGLYPPEAAEHAEEYVDAHMFAHVWDIRHKLRISDEAWSGWARPGRGRGCMG